jgi:formyl-CoA transferase
VLVADFSRVLAGPYASMLLGDLGADVIKVERPGTGDDTRAWGPPWRDGVSTYFLGLNRNKRSVVLDLTDAGDRELARTLAERADVLIESFRPGLMASWGLDGDTIRQVNPRLVSCSVTAFGSGEQAKGLPGYDFLLQAMGGLMSVTGEPDGRPLKAGAAVVDLICGLLATIGIQAALAEGGGRDVEVSLMDSALASLLNQGSAWVSGGAVPSRRGNRHPSIVPYETFAASDGEFVLAVGNEDLWRTFCEVAELDLGERFATNRQRVTQYDELRPLVAAALARHPRQFWIDRLTAAGVPCGSVRDFQELFADPQILEREMVAQLEHSTIGSLKTLGIPVKLSDTPGTLRTPPPTLGQHTDAILQGDLGMAGADVARLRAEKVV